MTNLHVIKLSEGELPNPWIITDDSDVIDKRAGRWTNGGHGFPTRGEALEALAEIEGETPIWNLYDGDTGKLIGPATAALVEASFKVADDYGFFLIDADGTVVDDGSWEAQQAGVRKVYVA